VIWSLRAVVRLILILGCSMVAVPAWAQRTSGPYEFNGCNVPQQLSIVREDENKPWWPPNWKTNRYNRYAGESSMLKMVPGSGLPTAKNPEGVVEHGPGNAQNCTYGYWPWATQWMVFRFRTQSYFGTEVGDHLAILLRASFSNMTQFGSEQYEGIGLALAKDWPLGSPGIFAERFLHPGGGSLETPALSFSLQDNVTYLVEIHAQTTHVGYRVTNEQNGSTTGWRTWYQPGYQPAVPGMGVGFAILCKDANARCENYNRDYRIDFWDIGSGWF
jgi:hypothetical protein